MEIQSMSKQGGPPGSTPPSDPPDAELVAHAAKLDQMISDLSRGEAILVELERRGEDVSALRQQYAPALSLLTLARQLRKKLTEMMNRAHAAAEVADLCEKLRSLVAEAGAVVEGLRSLAQAPPPPAIVHIHGPIVSLGAKDPGDD